MHISLQFLAAHGDPHAALLTSHLPSGEPEGAVLFVPPFAEEMMKSRQQFTQFAQRAVQENWACHVVDVRGTGDAGGTLERLNWDDWCDDVASAFQVCAAHGPVTVVGLRLGALLALDACARKKLPAAAFMLWEPQFSGKTAIKQFMRIAAVGAKMQGRAAETDGAEKTGQEVGGYWISTALEHSIAAAQPPATLNCAPALVLRLAAETSNSALPTIPPAWLPTLASWEAAGSAVTTEGMACPAFWTTSEIITHAPVNARSLEWLRAQRGTRT